MDQRPRSVPRRRALETALGLVAAVVVTTSVEAGMTVLEVGTFRNSGLGTIDYQGEFGMFVSSVAIDGISLTVVDPVDRTFAVAIIPATFDGTTLGRARGPDRPPRSRSGRATGR